MADQLQKRNEPVIVETGQIHGVHHSGPIPDPDTLERYKHTDISFPERIVKMAEDHNAADVRAKNRISLANLIVPIIGQIFTLILGCGGILACVYLAKAGYTGGAVAAVISSFSPMIISAFRSLRQNRR